MNSHTALLVHALEFIIKKSSLIQSLKQVLNSLSNNMYINITKALKFYFENLTS